MNYQDIFFDKLDEIDKIISAKPSKSNAQKIVSLLNEHVFARYIFSKVKELDWLVYLRDAGAFKYPLGKSPANDYWPQMEYLTEISKRDASAVLEISKPLLNEKNFHMQLGILKIATSLDVNQIKEVLPFIGKWFLDDKSFFPKEELSDLVNHLIQLKLEKELSIFFKNLLSIRVKEKTLSVDGKDHILKDLLPHIDLYHYREALEIFDAFFEKYPFSAIDTLYEVFVSLVELRQKANPPNDYSIIWCKDIDSPSTEAGHDIEDVLVAALRDFGLKFIKDEGENLKNVIHLLQRNNWSVFERFKLYFVAQKPHLYESITKSLLAEVNHIHRYDTEKEYLLLLKSSESLIDHNLLEAILREIEKGPQDLFEDPASPTEEEKKYAEIRTVSWTKKRLEVIHNKLSSEWKKKFTEYEKIMDQWEEDHPSPPSGVWWGPVSSKSFEDLNSATDSQLIEILQNEPRQPKARWLSSREGLARTFTAVIKSSPNRAVNLFKPLLAMDDIYIESALSGVREGLATFEEKNWESLLDFIFNVIAKPQSIQAVEGDERRSIKRTTAWLLNSGLQSQIQPLHTSLADKTWRLIEILCSENDPDAESENTSMDYYSRAINSVRGEALHCVVQFGLRKYSLEKNKKAPKMEERIAAALDRHIDIQYEKSLVVRSVYGRFLPWLTLIDPNWVKSNLSKIFPRDPAQEKYYNSVWETYLETCPVYDNVFDLIQAEYLRAVETLNISPSEDDTDEKPSVKLTEHLMTLYWRRKLDLKSQILMKFYENSDGKLRKSAISFIGRSVKNTSDKIPDDLIKHLQDLFDFRWNYCQKVGQFEEVASFGWWFASPHFPKGWRLSRLAGLLKKDIDVDPDFDFIEMFIEMRDQDPNLVLDCVEKILMNNRNFLLVTSKNEIRDLLQYYIKSQDQHISDRARIIVNKVGSRGFFDFRELIQSH